MAAPSVVCPAASVFQVKLLCKTQTAPFHPLCFAAVCGGGRLELLARPLDAFCLSLSRGFRPCSARTTGTAATLRQIWSVLMKPSRVLRTVTFRRGGRSRTQSGTRYRRRTPPRSAACWPSVLRSTRYAASAGFETCAVGCIPEHPSRSCGGKGATCFISVAWS